MDVHSSGSVRERFDRIVVVSTNFLNQSTGVSVLAETIDARVSFDELTRRDAGLLPRYVDVLERNGVAHHFASE